MGQGSKFFVSLSDLNLDSPRCPGLADLQRDPDWRSAARFTDRIYSVLGKLPPTERDVVELYYRVGKRQEVIARILGISQQAVSHRLYAAYRRIVFMLDLPDVEEAQMREDLWGLLPDRPFGVEVLCSFAQTGNQTENRPATGRTPAASLLASAVSPQAPAGSLPLSMPCYYAAYFERLLTHRSILCEIPGRTHDRRDPRPHLGAGAGAAAT